MRFDLYSKTNRLVLDGLVVGLSFYAAYLLSYRGHIPPASAHQVWALILPVVLGQLGMGFLFSVHRTQWRYVSIIDAFRLVKTGVAFSALLLLLDFGLPDRWALLRIPASAVVLDLILFVQGGLAIRLLRRCLYEQARKLESTDGQKPRRLLLIGAGLMGSTVAREMGSSAGIEILGFLDDDPSKIGTVVSGIRVLGPTSLATELVEEGRIDDVLVCIPPGRRNGCNRLWVMLEKLPIRSKFVPTIDEVLNAEIALNVNTGKPRSPISLGVTVASQSPESVLQLKSQIRDRTIVITGGAGFIGSSLAERLAAENQVVLLDRSFKKQPICFTSLMQHPNVRTIEADIMNEKVLCEQFREAEIVVHAAAIVGVERVCNHSRETIEVNLVGTSRVLQALESSNRLQRVIYFSTSEVFGVNSFRVNENSPSAIGPAAEARWSYSIAKLAGEHLVMSYYRQSGLPAVTIRPFNVFGPRRTGAHAIGQFVLNALTGKPIEVQGDGSQIRSWCYIEDFCDALVEMMARTEAIGEDFNIGNPRNTLTIYQLAQKIIDLTRSKVPVIFADNGTPDVVIRVPSLEKATRVLGYKPRYDLDRALALTVEWYKRNLDALATSKAYSGIRAPMNGPLPESESLAATGD